MMVEFLDEIWWEYQGGCDELRNEIWVESVEWGLQGVGLKWENNYYVKLEFGLK